MDNLITLSIIINTGRKISEQRDNFYVTWSVYPLFTKPEPMFHNSTCFLSDPQIECWPTHTLQILKMETPYYGRRHQNIKRRMSLIIGSYTNLSLDDQRPYFINIKCGSAQVSLFGSFLEIYKFRIPSLTEVCAQIHKHSFF